MKWTLTKDEKPTEKGEYFVTWANPYEPEVGYKTDYWLNGRFLRDRAGANFIIAWMKPEPPDVTEEERNILVK